MSARMERALDGAWLKHALAGVRVINLGQLSPGDVRDLDRAARRGVLVKGREHWYPGLGPLKTVWRRA
jgi:hypothetical protein